MDIAEKNFAEEIAGTILAQLGGWQFVCMTGSRDFTFSEDKDGRPYLQMHLARNKSGANRLTITYLEGLDEYGMRFWKYTAPRWDYKRMRYHDASVKDIKVIEDGVFCDTLCEVFEEITGLRTNLF